MCNETTDEPRQVLAILNSLGIVNVTAQELKTFLKTLKLYRKVKQKNIQEWKKEIFAKILQKQEYFEDGQLNLQNLSILNTIIVHENKKVHSNCPQTITNKFEYINTKKVNEIEKTSITASLEENSKYPKNNKLYCKLHRNTQDSKTNIQISIHPTQKIKTPTSKFIKTGSKSSSISQSLIKSRNKTKVVNDPVTLYNYYKGLWKQLSIPGEETHTKLRWAVREKILGSNFSKA